MPPSRTGVPLGAVFDALPTAYLVLRPDLTIAAANREFLRLVDRELDDLLDRPGFEVFPPGEVLDTEGGHPVRLLYERVLATGRLQAAPLLRWDVAPRGSGPLLERWWSLTISPVTAEDGTTQLLLGHAEDVTDYVRDRERHDADGSAPRLEATLYSRLQQGRASQLAQALAAQRMSRFADTASRLAAAQTLDDLVRIVTVHALSVLGADGGGIAVPADDGRWRLVGSSSFTDQHRADWELVPHDSPLPVCHSARTGQRVLLPTAGDADAFDPVMAEVRAGNGRRAWATLPLAVDGVLLGGLAVSWAEDHPFTPEEVDLLEGCAAQCAQALERISSQRVAEEEVRSVRRMAETLQRSLLSQPPVREGLQLATRYQPAARGAEVGGDWFDAFPTRSGGTVLVVGDVSGHDQTAAAAMSQVRNLVRGICYDGDDRPANLLTRLDQAVAGLDLGTLATAVLAVVDAPVSGVAGRRLRWVSAGHPPPLLRRHDGRVERLESSDDLLLGLDPATVRHEHTLALVPGDLLLLYTDGLVERRDADLDDGIERVADALRAADGVTAGIWADRVLGTLGPAGAEDDAALLVVRVEIDDSPDALPSGAGDPQEIVLPADPRSVRDARRLTRRCCHRVGLPDAVADTAELLTSELVTNAVVHGRSEVRVRVTTTRDLVHVEVSDDNHRRPVLQAPDDDALSGRGLSLLENTATRWGVEDASLGKVVWFSLETG